MAVNKIVLNTDDGEQVLVDLTGDSVSEGTLFEGETAHAANGEKIVGTFALESEMSEQDALIEQIKTALEGKAAGSAPLPTQEKSVDITENGVVEVTPDEGYTLSKVTANVNVAGSGGEGGTFTLRIVAVEERIDCITYIYYSSNGHPRTWEWDGIPVSEIIINDVDVESIIVINAGVFDGNAQLFTEEFTGNYPEHNLTRVVDNVIYIGHQVGSTEIIEIYVYS